MSLILSFTPPWSRLVLVQYLSCMLALYLVYVSSVLAQPGRFFYVQLLWFYDCFSWFLNWSKYVWVSGGGGWRTGSNSCIKKKKSNQLEPSTFKMICATSLSVSTAVTDCLSNTTFLFIAVQWHGTDLENVNEISWKQECESLKQRDDTKKAVPRLHSALITFIPSKLVAKLGTLSLDNTLQLDTLISACEIFTQGSYIFCNSH